MGKTFATAIALSILASTVFADSAGLDGRWTVTWLSNSSQNVMTLRASGSGSVLGSYTNDAGSDCPVSGNFSATNGALTLEIACPKWKIDMDGALAPGGKTAQGHYRAYSDSVGEFRMEKQ